ncbi:MAG: alkylmercury lyase [Dehalococcoidia bacterium]|nr:alkylmercury lyase [Dehalococcoidia bacterium]
MGTEDLNTSCGCDDSEREILERLHAPILRILADGRPASAAELARATALGEEQVAAMVGRLSLAEVDGSGRVLGLGLSFIPTPHRVSIEGRHEPLYAWCAPDALLLPGTVGPAARIASACPATGERVTVTLDATGVAEVEPPSAVVSFVRVPDPADRRATGCDHMHFFASAEAAAGWLEEHDGFVLPVAEAVRALRAIAESCNAALLSRAGEETTEHA